MKSSLTGEALTQKRRDRREPKEIQMNATKRAHVQIDIDDVVRHGSVEAAIEAWAEIESRQTASGVIGPEFSTSGPGSGWSKTHDASDFAERAVSDSYGALYYIDSYDGRLASRPGWTEEGTSDEHPIEWTDESVVEVICPDFDDAMEHPEAVAKMASSVIEHHYAESDLRAWKMLIQSIQDAAKEIEDIDADDFERSSE
jgi:hypothetical protein